MRTFCPPHLLEEIERDLLQKFEKDVKIFGESKAKRRLLWNVIRYFRLGILLRNKWSAQMNTIAILHNYLVTSLRHIRKSKVNFSFKLGGLTLALFSFLAITIYVSYQFSFDRFHHDYENTYRVTSQRKDNGIVENYAIVPLALNSVLQQLPEINRMARINFANNTSLRYNDQVYDCEALVAADSTIFDVLTFEFIKGNRRALRKPNSIALTRSLANVVFGTTDALQKTLSINKELYEVTAVIEDTKPNSHLYLQAIIPLVSEIGFSAKSITEPVAFSDESATLYVRFNQPIDETIYSKVESILDSYIPKADRITHGFAINFQPLANIHLGSHFRYRYEFAQTGNAVYVYAFSVLGVLLLVVAGINYINLSVADFTTRARETGVRKVLGARKRQLLIQVTLETFLVVAIALLLAILLLYLLFPHLTQLLDSGLSFSLLLKPQVVLFTSLTLLAVILFATGLPARQFTRSTITQNLKSIGAGYNSSISRVLLFAQFAISGICIVCTLVIGQQIGFIHNKSLGFDRKNLLVLSLPEEFTVKKMQAFKQ